MQQLIVQPMQWGLIPDINEVSSLTEDDRHCFRDIRDVLLKYGALDRFGLTLIHKHFDMAESETLVESVDMESRTLTIRPMDQCEIDASQSIVTNWKLTEGEEVAERVCICIYSNGHTGRHGSQ